MSRPRIRALAAVVLAGALLSVPSVGASGSEASTIKFVAIQTEPNHDPTSPPPARSTPRASTR